jgi:hypothetical protein
MQTRKEHVQKHLGPDSAQVDALKLHSNEVCTAVKLLCRCGGLTFLIINTGTTLQGDIGRMNSRSTELPAKQMGINRKRKEEKVE